MMFFYRKTIIFFIPINAKMSTQNLKFKTYLVELLRSQDFFVLLHKK